MTGVWHVTYDIVTEESSRIGDYDESGFISATGERVQAVINGVAMTFRQAFDVWQAERSTAGYVEANTSDISAARWFTDYDSRGASFGDCVNVSLHIPDNITPASRYRLARLVNCYGV